MKRRASQDHATSAWIFLNLLHKLAIHVLQAVALVHNDVAPVNLLHVLPVSNDDIIRSDSDWRPLVDIIRTVVLRVHDSPAQLGSLVRSSMVENGRDLRMP